MTPYVCRCSQSGSTGSPDMPLSWCLTAETSEQGTRCKCRSMAQDPGLQALFDFPTSGDDARDLYCHFIPLGFSFFRKLGKSQIKILF